MLDLDPKALTDMHCGTPAPIEADTVRQLRFRRKLRQLNRLPAEFREIQTFKLFNMLSEGEQVSVAAADHDQL